MTPECFVSGHAYIKFENDEVLVAACMRQNCRVMITVIKEKKDS